MRNLITDVPGLKVGHADDARLASGVTAIVFDEPAVASADVRGGGPGTREIDLLDRRRRSSASTRSCCRAGRPSGSMPPAACRPGCASRAAALRSAPARVPIVPGAILFDLLQRRRQGLGPLSALSRARLCGRGAATQDFALGSAGAGFGATTVNLKGGLGSASAQTRDGITVGAIVAVNAVGSVTVGDGPHFWAAPFEQRQRIRRARPAVAGPARCARVRAKGSAAREHHHRGGRDRRRADQGAGASGSPSWRRTAWRARSIRCTRRSTATSCSRRRPAARPLADPIYGLAELGTIAADVLARAIARGVYEATRPALPRRAAELEGQVFALACDFNQ